MSFFSLEHIYNLNTCIKEIKRVLKRNGKLIFAIPNEGSFAWGFARYLISRRWMIKNTDINYDKIICWEHPNFATKIIKNLPSKDSLFETVLVSINDELVRLYLSKKISYSHLLKKLLNLLSKKEFKKYKFIEPKNITDILNLNKYIKSKIV